MKLSNQIESIMCENKGEIFSINDFYHLGTKNTVKSVLYRLNEQNKISRVIDGLYVNLEYSDTLNEYCYPSVDEVAKKIAEKFSWKIAPSGEVALNYTGLSTQVPNEYIYITDGEYRQYLYRGKKIIFKHTSNRNIFSYPNELIILIQAIKALGKDNITKTDLERLSIFAKNIKQDLSSDTLKLPYWICEVLFKL